ncbi:Glycerol kinase [Candidatus Hepatincolaceae symbiont of Richtersius coronifer]
MAKYILSLDQGTTSSRSILFDKQANVKGVSQKEFTQYYPQNAWVEHDPNEIWSSQLGVMTEVLAQSGVKPSEIAALGITNQRETTIVWDKTTGQAIYNAIVWQDRRTAQYCDELKTSGKDQIFLKKTGLVLDAYFSGTKIKWILDNVKGAREKANKGELAFGTVDSWLIYKLTGGKVHATDKTNASRTLLYNIIKSEWDEELLSILDIPKSILPEVKQSSELYGVMDKSHLGAEISIAGVAGDQHAATFGQACLETGMVKNTYGTGCFMLLNIGKQAIITPDKLLTTIAWSRKDTVTYALEGSVFIGGAVVQWLRDGLEIIRKSEDVEPLAATVEDSGGVYLVPAFVGLGAPHWDSYARGTMIGITRNTSKAHIARAALDSIALQTSDILFTMERASGIKIKELRVDGGASRNNALMQFQADILDVNIVRPKIVETTALGAAYLAGLAVGFWQSADEIVSLWQKDVSFEPKMKASKRDEILEQWNKAVGRSKDWIAHNVSKDKIA